MARNVPRFGLYLARGACTRRADDVTILYYDNRFLEHDTGVHPERPERLRKIIAKLETTGLAAQCTRPEWKPASRQRLERIHEPGHIDRVAALAAHGGGHLDPDTVVS